MTNLTADIVICGAGSIGVAAAYYLAKQQHIHDIIIVDQFDPLSQTSAKSGENYRNWWPQDALVRLMNHSIDLMEAIAISTDNRINLTRRGYFYTAASAKGLQQIQDNLLRFQNLPVGGIRRHESATTANYNPKVTQKDSRISGADILLDPDLIQKHFPHLSPRLKGAIHVRRAGDLSAQQLGTYFLREAKKLGVREIRGQVTHLESNDAGISAVSVETHNGRLNIATNIFLNAAGPFANAIAEMVDITLPISNILQQKIAIQDPDALIPRSAPFTILMDEQYLPWVADEKALIAQEPELAWLLEKFPGGLHLKPEGGLHGNWLKLGWAINKTAEPPTWQPARQKEFMDALILGATDPGPWLEALCQPYYQTLLALRRILHEIRSWLTPLGTSAPGRILYCRCLCRIRHHGQLCCR